MIHTGDAIEVMAGMPADSVDAVVTDPPYGLEFMGKEWDGPKAWRDDANRREKKREREIELGYSKKIYGSVDETSPAFYNLKPKHLIAFQAWCEAWGREALRVTKPGGYLLAFGGTRTHHRLVCGLEDAGWEIRDELDWIFASGFPKSLDVGKAMDRARDDSFSILVVVDFLATHRGGVSWDEIDRATCRNARQKFFTHSTPGMKARVPTWDQWLSLKALMGFGDEMDAEVWRLNGRKGQPGEAWDQREKVGADRSGPATIAFARDGATEFDITAPATELARKWDGWGTALKPAHEPIVLARKPLTGSVAANVTRYGTGALNIGATRIGDGPSQGRWPSNLLLQDPELFDEPNPYVVGSGATATSGGIEAVHSQSSAFGGGRHEGNGYGDSGGYSRFFIVPKADRSDREPVLRGQQPSTESLIYSPKEQGPLPQQTPSRPTARENVHPTVKPTDLMRHLVRLVTPSGGTVLDCFAGSGSTLIAAELEGFPWIGIEQDPSYVAIAEARLNGTQRGLGLDVGAPTKAPPKTHPDLAKHQPKVQRRPTQTVYGKFAGFDGTDEEPAA